MATGSNKGKKGLEYWRTKAELRRREIKRLRIQIKRLEKSRVMWRQRCKLKEGEYGNGRRVKHHRYSVEIMMLGLIMHIVYNVSLRAVRGTLLRFGELRGLKIGRLSATTIRDWSMRFGLYYLSSRCTGGNYVLILDESVSIGQEKILLILGVPLSEYQSRIAPLRMHDVEVLHVSSQNSWKGCEVSALIEQWRCTCGATVAYAISDSGANLKNGLNLSKIPWVYDCSHVISNQIQKMFEKDEALNTLVKHMNTTRTLWPSSQWAPYMPPSMRKKARFHQVLTLYVWAEMMLDRYDQLPPTVRSQLVYLHQYKDLIQTLKTLSMLVEKFCDIFKAKGINPTTIGRWQQEAEIIRQKSSTQQPKITAFINALNTYIQQTSAALPHHDQIICCSDVIESMFGKYKNKSGARMISADILKIAAFNQKIEMDDVHQAMLSTSNQDVRNWAKQNTVPSLLAIKRKLLNQFLAA